MAYLRGLPEPLASKPDAELLLGDTRLAVHTQIASLHSTGGWQGTQRMWEQPGALCGGDGGRSPDLALIRLS